ESKWVAQAEGPNGALHGPRVAIVEGVVGWVGAVWVEAEDLAELRRQDLGDVARLRRIVVVMVADRHIELANRPEVDGAAVVVGVAVRGGVAILVFRGDVEDDDFASERR